MMALETRRIFSAAFTAFAILCALVLAQVYIGSASGQVRFGRRNTERQTVFAIPPREATRPLKIAQKAIEDADYVQATRLLGDLLADPMLNEFLIPHQEAWGRAVSLRHRAEQMMGQIPLEQRAFYEEKYGVRARVLLDEGIAKNDNGAIASASRLFFHTEAGLEATMLVGHSHLSLGRPVIAAQAFGKVAAHSQGRQRFDPEATMLAAIGWALGGSSDRAEKLLGELKKRHGDAEVTFYGKKVRLLDQDTPLQTWLEEVVSATPLEAHPVINQWLVYRGDARRNAESGSGFPLLSPRWSLRTVADPVDEEGIREFQQKLIRTKVSPMPKVHPLAVGDTLVIRTENRMFGVDSKTGKRIWCFPPTSVFQSSKQRDEPWETQSAKVHQDKIRERLWLDALYGQISSNGNSIFLIPNPGVSTDRDDWRSYETQVYDEPTDLRKYNELKSLDLKQQGALQWQVGGETGLDEPQLARAFFLGAPLPIGDRLYAICFQEQSVRLVVLDADTGRLMWARHLASTEESVLFREDRGRRLAGATPSEANGILICPTGLNAIVAVDIATQSLNWGFQFDVPSRTRGRLTDQLTKWDTLWRDASVTLTGGTVVYTPVNSENIYCLNLLSGEPLWGERSRRKSGWKSKAMHVETVREGEIVLACNDRLRAVNLKTGEQSWEYLLGDFGLVSGRGYVSGEHCYIPTTTKHVLRVNVVTGELQGTAMTDRVLGNLVCFRGDVISHGADHLSAYPRDEPSRRLLERAAEEQIDTHSVLAVKAQLHLRDKDYSNAVDAISRAYDLFPNSNYGKVLVEALTRLMEVDFAKAEQVSDKYQSVFQEQDLQRQLLRGKVVGLVKLERLNEAFEALVQVAEAMDLSPPSNAVAGQGIEGGQGVSIAASTVDATESLAKSSANAEITMRLKQWLRWQLSEVYHRSDQAAKESFQEIVVGHLAAFKHQSLPLRHQRMRLFPFAAVGDRDRFEMAAELFARDFYAEASGILGKRFLADRGSAGQGRGAFGHASRLLEEMQTLDLSAEQIANLEDAVERMKADREAAGDVLLPDYYESSSDQSGDVNRLRADLPPIGWHRDVVRTETEPNSDHFIGTQYFCDVVTADQPELRSALLSFRVEFREFRLYDRLGRLAQRIYLDPGGEFGGVRQGTRGRVFLHKSLMLLCIEQEMFAIDWEKFVAGKPALLWSADGVMASSAGVGNDSLDGICVLSKGMLMCLSPFTGEVMWQRTQVGPRTLLEKNESLSAWDRASRTFDNFDRKSGRLLSVGRMPRDGGSTNLMAGNLQLFVASKLNAGDDPEVKSNRSKGDGEAQRGVIGSTKLDMVDFFGQETVWSRTLGYPAQLCLVDQNRILALSDGVFSMIDVATGELKFETQAPGLEGIVVSGINVEQLNGRLVVSVNSNAQQESFMKLDDVRVTFKRMHKGNALLSGLLVVLDDETGAKVWTHPVAVERFQLLGGIPWDSPFLFLARKNFFEAESTTEVLQLAMIDLQTGKLKANELLKVSIRDDPFYKVVCQPKGGTDQTQTIDLQIATLDTRFHLDSLLTSPQPVASLVNRNSLRQFENGVASKPASLSMTTDLDALVEKATKAEAKRIEMGKEEVRLIEIEMQSK